MNNLLDIRKLEEGKMRIRSRPLSLSHLVDDVHKMMKSSVRPSVKFQIRKDIPSCKTWVLGDEHRIQQILTNVVTNAVKYTLKGSITLSVSWEGDSVRLECIDTGPGIPKSEQDRLFERFVQRGGAPGTGLGLNIALQIVDMMQGSIGFESDPTVKPGTTCRVLLPLTLCDPQPDDDDDEDYEPDDLTNGGDRAPYSSSAAAAGSVRHTKSRTTPTSGAASSVTTSSTTATRRSGKRPKKKAIPMIQEPLHILIVDDIRMNRAMLSRRIEKTIAPNAVIFTADTGETALVLCEDKKFDIIIQDQFMEEAGGVMLGTDTIIAMRRNNVSSYIVGCSGNDLDAEFYDSGADRVWGKPLPCNADIIRQWRAGLMLPSPSEGSKESMKGTTAGEILVSKSSHR